MQSIAETIERKNPRSDPEQEVDLVAVAAELAQLERHLDERNAAHREARRVFGERVETVALGLSRVGAEPSPSAASLIEAIDEAFGPWTASLEDTDERLRREILELRRQATAERVRLLDRVSQELHSAQVAFLEMEARAEHLHLELEREAADNAARAAREEEEATAKTAVSVPALRLAPEPEAPIEPPPEAAAAPADAVVDDGPNRRLSPRVTLACEVNLDTESNFYEGLAENISATGIFLASYDLLEVGSAVAVSFTLPGSEVIETEAIVRWVRDPVDERSPLWPGMGLEFQGLDAAQQAAIDAFVKTREPLFFPND